MHLVWEPTVLMCAAVGLALCRLDASCVGARRGDVRMTARICAVLRRASPCPPESLKQTLGAFPVSPLGAFPVSPELK